MPAIAGVVIFGAYKMNYPKMFYKGTQQNYQHIIADTLAQEENLLEQGWVEYAELPKTEPDTSPKYASASAGSGMGRRAMDQDNMVEGFISTEQFDAISATLTKTEDLLQQSNAEIVRLNQIIDAGSAENAELRERLTFFQNEGPAEVVKDATDLNALTAEQLREMIIAQGGTFKQRDSKPELIAILES